MAFKILRKKITCSGSEAIVNGVLDFPLFKTEVDYEVFKKAGRKKLFSAFKKLHSFKCGKAVCTSAYKLKEKGIKYIFHTRLPYYFENEKEAVSLLKKCYRSSLNLAKEKGCKSVAIPLLGSKFSDFPEEIDIQIAKDEISRFVSKNEIDVNLVISQKTTSLISEKLFNDVQKFIRKNLKSQKKHFPCDPWFLFRKKDSSIDKLKKKRNSKKDSGDYLTILPEPLKIVKKGGKENRVNPVKYGILSSENMSTVGASTSLSNHASTPFCKRGNSSGIEVFLNQALENLNFQDTLQKFIASRNLDNSSVYKKALLDRRFFSKIISKKNYIPKKMTVMALGLSLELDLNEYEELLTSAGYSFMPSSKFDMIVKYCVINRIYNLIEINLILDSYGEKCFSSE